MLRFVGLGSGPRSGGHSSTSGFALLGLAVVFFLWGPASAEEKPLPPSPSAYVLDEPAVLKPKTREVLSKILAAENSKTGNQLVLAVFKELGEEDLVVRTNKTFKAWAIGSKGKDNGVLLALYWKERKIRIEVGYGLEPLLTDARAKRVLAEKLIPELKAKRPDEGVVLAIREILTVIQSPLVKSGEFDRLLAGGGFRFEGRPGPMVQVGIWGIVVVILLFLFGGFLWVLFQQAQMQTRNPLLRRRRGSNHDNWWWGGGGGWGGGSSGGSSSGGGGFSGGGGSSGGGGASGEW